MKIKCMLLVVLLGTMVSALLAQSEYNVSQITVVNMGDGRLLFRTLEKEHPLEGQHRLIDGYKSEYILANFSKGLFNGVYQRFRNNNLVEKGNYKEGVRDGDFVEYYSDGTTVKSQKTFKEGRLNGILRTFYTNGKPEIEQGYKDGVEDGIDRRYHYETGKLTLDCFYLNGKPEGKQVKNISSNIGNYVEVSLYKNGLLNGEFTQTWENGQGRVKGVYKDGKKEGKWIDYRKDGKIEREVAYKAGEKNGESKMYFTDGTIEKIENYVNDSKEGVSKEFYYDSNKLKAEYSYLDDVKNGKYSLYYDDGSLREEGRMEAGREMYRKEFYKGGQVKRISERNSKGSWETIEEYDSKGKQL